MSKDKSKQKKSRSGPVFPVARTALPYAISAVFYQLSPYIRARISLI